jgi:hypothetical protein
LSLISSVGNVIFPKGVLVFPFCLLSRKEKETKKLCVLCVSNDPDKSGEWAVSK